MTGSEEKMARRICVYGIVQGVGFRPFVSRAAKHAGVAGSVANKGSFVEIFAEGSGEQLEALMAELKNNPPERSAILKIDSTDCASRGWKEFQIIESEKETGDIFVSPDIAICPKCREELYDPGNRRYMHPFINCTACGPRLTILDRMPYDRQRTSMGEFPMCPECEKEYHSPKTRRYDAQPVCCNDCGPEVYLVGDDSLRGREAITAVRRALLDGKIAAIKGIGGFHLCCNAENEEAVMRLRERKHRPVKPFAVMTRNLDSARRECRVLPEMEEILDGHQKPILLMEKREGGCIAEAVAPNNPKIGMMLPYTPLHLLLFDCDDEVDMTIDNLVMTSANASGAPICRTEEDALDELGDLCDIILSHNREIRLRADDSVMDWYHGEPYMIRRSRGYAPLPMMLSRTFEGEVLAVGGELKNTFCIGKNNLFYLSPYVGDMGDVRAVRAMEESILRMKTLLEAEPSGAACDLHPKYNTVRVAEEQNLPLVPVQHHHAHILSCMAENDYTGDVIGVSFDGTGYGSDGSIWGGEILRTGLSCRERLGHIRTFRHVGGDRASREGWRIAVSMLNDLYGDEASRLVSELKLCSEQEQTLMKTMAERGINTVASTSAGRLFDAVSAILGICRESSFEGEASTALMFRAQGDDATAMPVLPEAVSAELTELTVQENRVILPVDRLVRFLVEETLKGTDAEMLAAVFHRVLAAQIGSAVRWASEHTGLTVCAFSGGVFQNTLLLGLCEESLEGSGIRVLRHRMIPPNDGGIALGQALAAMAERQKSIN